LIPNLADSFADILRALLHTAAGVHTQVIAKNTVVTSKPALTTVPTQFATTSHIFHFHSLYFFHDS
jgi:hypothetical protein